MSSYKFFVSIYQPSFLRVLKDTRSIGELSFFLIFLYIVGK